MKTSIALVIAAVFIVSNTVNAQTSYPAISFEEDPLTHNMHICSDGKFYYTVNGGKANMGQIGKFSLDGVQISSYDIELDMRSIMYNKKDKSLYVTTYEKSIYKITDLEGGIYKEVYSNLIDNGQCIPALSPKGKKLYIMDSGTLEVIDFKTGETIDTFYGMKTGDEILSGSTAVAVSKKNIYTWDADDKKVYIYDMDGEFVRSIQLSDGSYGFSLSWANEMLFVSTDGDYDTGAWYGYEL